MVQWTSEGEGRQLASSGAPHIDVEVVDIYGNEYVHLVRTDDGWMIANALWHLT
jgi:hypothetical protein